MMETEGSGGPYEGNGGSDFVRGKGAVAAEIRLAGREQGRAGGGEHRHQGVG